jgi:hypothetical protein
MEIGDPLQRRRVSGGRRHQLFKRGGCGYALFGAGLFSRSLFWGSRHFWRRLFIPGLQTGVCRWGLLRAFSEFCRSGFWKVSGLCFGNTASSEHVVPVIAEGFLLGRWLGASGRRTNTSRGCAAHFSRPRRCPPYKRDLLFLPLSAAPIVRGVVSSAATAFKLFFGCRAPALQVGLATRNAPRCVTAATLGMSKALAAPELHGTSGGRVGLHSRSEPT